MGNVDEGITHPEIRDKFGKCNVYTKEACKDCFARFYCSGGCAANAYHFQKDINGNYGIGCELQRKRVECAIMIKAPCRFSGHKNKCKKGKNNEEKQEELLCCFLTAIITVLSVLHGRDWPRTNRYRFCQKHQDRSGSVWWCQHHLSGKRKQPKCRRYVRYCL